MIKRTIIIVTGILLLSFVMNGAANWLESQPSAPDQKFEVVDRYDNRCDVVQYTPTNAARYTYFLDCKK
jgi:hypothetical protein